MLNVCKRYSSLALLLTLLLFSCGGEQTENTVLPDSVKTEKPVLTFAVAGHIYGNSDHYTHSIYPPFLKKFKEDQSKHDFDFLFLTGDVLYDSSKETWFQVKSQLDSLDVSWYIAKGNHDYWDNFGAIRSFVRNDFGFLVLDISNPGWTLNPGILNFLETTLMQMKDRSNIFVFTHQLWWQRNPPAEFELDSVRPNSFALYDGPSDFWKDVFPYFDSTGIETWFFAGDLGADEKLESYYEDHHNQFHFYASGMGGGKADNYLIVEVYQNGHVDIETVSF